MSMQYQWNAYRGEGEMDDGIFGKRRKRTATPSTSTSTSTSTGSRVFSMRRRSSGSLFFHRGNKDDEAEVFLHGGSPLIIKQEDDHESLPSSSSSIPDFRIGGCFRRRNCVITAGRSGQLVARIARKKANSTVLLGDDVFSLIVQPGFDIHLIMAFVIILDRICAKPYAPLLCS